MAVSCLPMSALSCVRGSLQVLILKQAVRPLTSPLLAARSGNVTKVFLAHHCVLLTLFTVYFLFVE